ncbi:hypothetical protein JW921_00440, partial [Candidatus Fermentibacterales bacterium]|nr:hypothetical protein [Candidatus Fermentibacterales bacterium]
MLRRAITVTAAMLLALTACGGGGLEIGKELPGEIGRESGYLSDYWEEGCSVMLAAGRPLEDDLYAASVDVASGGGVRMIEV